MTLFRPRSDLVVDLFLVVLVALLPVLLLAVAQARRGRILLHARLMKGAFLLFLAALLAFEIRVRTGNVPPPALLPFLFHLPFALPCLLLWGIQLASGKRAAADPAPHRRRGKIVIALYAATAATGAWVYFASF